MPGWFTNFISSAGFNLAVGGFLAFLGGVAATYVQEKRQRSATRIGLGKALYGELINSSPREDPLYYNPDCAMRLSLRSLPQVLAPGVLDPDKENDLFMQLISLAKIVDEFNERAALWDEAFAAGADDEKLDTLYHALISSNWDYQKAHAWTLRMLWRLGPPLGLIEHYEDRNRWQTFRREWERYRSKKVRQVWVTHNHEMDRLPGSPELVEPHGNMFSDRTLFLVAFVPVCALVVVLVIATAFLQF